MGRHLRAGREPVHLRAHADRPAAVQQGVVFTGSPAVAEGWDDWGPFYTQTYGAYFGVDGSTLEMCNNAACGGRLGSKTAQYLGFYSSADSG